MKHSFHCSLRKSFRWYHNWHNHPRHQHAHWAFFAAMLLIVFSLLSREMGNFYLEKEYQAQAQASITITQSGDRWSVNGNQKFLLLVSYFDGLGASQATLNSDFSALRSRGFDGVRVLIDWPCSSCPGSTQYRLLNPDGSYRTGMLARLTNLLQTAQANGLIVDLTFHDWQNFNSLQAYQIGLTNTARDIMAYRGVIFDLQNEANGVGGGLSTSQVRTLRDAVKAVDSNRLVTASVAYGMTPSEVPNWFIPAGLDFVAFHDSRSGDWPGNTDNVVNAIRSSLGSTLMPIYLQEPERYRGTAPYKDSPDDWITAATNAKCAGAAGWTFHNDAGYDLTTSAIFNRFNSVENQIANGLSGALSSTVWFSCTGEPIPPPPPGPGGPPYGKQYNCPAGFIELGGANASSVDNSATPGYFCDEDAAVDRGPNPEVTQITYPVTGRLYCGSTGNGTAFIVDGADAPCNSREISPSWPSGWPGWEFRSGRPYLNGNQVSLYGERDCNSLTEYTTVTIDSSRNVGAWTQVNTGRNGYFCIPGTDLSKVSPPVIYYVFPNQAQFGGTLLIVGEKLIPTVEILDSNRTSTVLTGTLNATATEVTISIPNFTPGNYTVRVGTGPSISNEMPFQIISGIFVEPLSPLLAPIITGLNPVIAAQGATIEILGNSLTPNVQFFDTNNVPVNVTGTVNSDFTITTVAIPFSVAPGIYTVGITSSFGSAVSQDVLTVLEGSPGVTAQAAPPPLPTTQSTFQDLISSAFNYSIILVGIAVFIMIMWGGFLWLTSAANPSNISRARGIIFNAILGAVLLVSAYVILYTINPELVGGTFTLPGIQAPAPVPLPPPGGGDACNDSGQLAQQHNNAFYGPGSRRAPDLDNFLLCLGNQIGVGVPPDGGSNSFYGNAASYDRSSPLCNYTRGDGHCDSTCSHSQNSCHYGGITGTQGALAIDFENVANSVQIRQAALVCNAKRAECEDSSRNTVTCPGGTHIHISTRSCDKDIQSF